MGKALNALVGTDISRCRNSLAGARSPQAHGSGMILSEQIPGSEFLTLVIRVVLKVRDYRYF
jgi:hypothetical protein